MANRGFRPAFCHLNYLSFCVSAIPQGVASSQKCRFGVQKFAYEKKNEQRFFWEKSEQSAKFSEFAQLRRAALAVLPMPSRHSEQFGVNCQFKIQIKRMETKDGLAPR